MLLLFTINKNKKKSEDIIPSKIYDGKYSHGDMKEKSVAAFQNEGKEME
jgi:hypothetical protein